MTQLLQNAGQGDAGDGNGGNGGNGGFDQDEFIVSSPELTIELATEQIWTVDEFMEAEPCDVIELDEDKLTEKLGVSQGKEGLSEGGEPELESEGEPDPQATSGGYNYPPPFTRYEVFCDYRIWPYRTVGKLFFRRGGKSYVCSAASIGNNAIWTAGHCLHAGNNKRSGWSTNVVFVPAYKDGNAPYGQWPARQLFTSRKWYQHGIPGGLSEDWGAATLFPQKGRKISQRVGWLGFAWNWSRYQHWHALGYPAAAPFNGQRLIATAASFAYTGALPGVDSNGFGSDMTGGCSGGPVIMRFGSANYLNGNNSYRRSNKPKELFSPYFNSNTKKFWDVIIAK